VKPAKNSARTLAKSVSKSVTIGWVINDANHSDFPSILDIGASKWSCNLKWIE